ncbi:MAG: sensor histidine kinase [Anaerovoracaceae bacterium]
MSKKKKLTNRLLVMIPACILLVLTVTSAAVHIIMKDYIDEITSNSINEAFMSRCIDDNMNYDAYSTDDTKVYFPVNIFIVNSSNEIIGDLPTSKEKKQISKILSELSRRRLYSDEEKISMDINNDTYIVEKRTYEGYSDGYFIYTSPDVLKDINEKYQTYTVYVYINTGSVSKIIKKMDLVILILFASSAILSILLIMPELRKVRGSFNALNEYLIRVGRREPDLEKIEMEYREFDQVSDTIDKMSHIIKKSEKVQKDFFQNASHELRTPLTSIRGYTEGIMHGAVDKEKGLKVIYKQSLKMSKLVDQILYMTKFDNMEIKYDKINIAAIIYEAASVLLSAGEKTISFENNLADKVEVIGDEELIEKVVDNILSNAYRYARSKVGASLRSTGEFTIIDITDDGDGIDPVDLDHIFERFYKGKGGNFGIGLSLASDIMKKHGGRIDVKSESGFTCFSLVFKNQII